MTYRIRGLSADLFAHLNGLTDAELVVHGARRVIAKAGDSLADRIALSDLREGETALLTYFEHQSADTPYRASHAVYVRECPGPSYDAVDRVPPILQGRLLSIRGFTASGMLADADVVAGDDALDGGLRAMLAAERVAYVHVHFAAPGCFAAKVTRS
jgi:hypothetical protein